MVKLDSTTMILSMYYLIRFHYVGLPCTWNLMIMLCLYCKDYAPDFNFIVKYFSKLLLLKKTCINTVAFIMEILTWTNTYLRIRWNYIYIYIYSCWNTLAKKKKASGWTRPIRVVVVWILEGADVCVCMINFLLHKWPLKIFTFVTCTLTNKC